MPDKVPSERGQHPGHQDSAGSCPHPPERSSSHPHSELRRSRPVLMRVEVCIDNKNFEVLEWLMREGGDRFLVIFLIFKKIDPEKLAVHTFVSETFCKNYNISKVK